MKSLSFSCGNKQNKCAVYTKQLKSSRGPEEAVGCGTKMVRFSKQLLRGNPQNNYVHLLTNVNKCMSLMLYFFQIHVTTTENGTFSTTVKYARRF